MTTRNQYDGWIANGMLLWMLLLTFAPASLRAAVDTDPKLSENGIPEGYMVIEGDVIVPVDFYAGGLRGTFTSLSRLWTEGDPAIIRYEFDTSGTDAVSTANQAVALNAMAAWEAVADVDFRARSGQSTYIRIRDSTNDTNPANDSPVGVSDIQPNVINYTSWGNQWSLVHELGHALGYWHEQSRADRGTACDGGPCITIEWNNICQDCCTDSSGNAVACDYNFTIRSSGDEYGDYDFDSIMHYAACVWSCCNSGSSPCSTAGCTSGNASCRAITVNPPNDAQWQANIGQRTHLSCWDAEVMSFLYPESDWRFVDADCQWWGTSGACSQYGEFLRPYTDIATGINETPCGGELILRSGGHFNVNGILSKPMLIRAPVGGALLCH